MNNIDLNNKKIVSLEEISRQFEGRNEVIPISLSLSSARKIDRSLSLLNLTMKKCLLSQADPAFYVLSADAGTGKSRTVQRFIADWKTEGFPGNGSILVMLSTNKEIASYIDGCGLDRSDYAVFSSDKALAGYGLGRDRAQEAKVLFVTHENLRRRVAEHETFADIQCYQFNGKPRTLRLWDESLIPANPVSIKVDILAALPRAIRRFLPDMADAVQAMLPEVSTLVDGSLIEVPIELKSLGNKVLGLPEGAADREEQNVAACLSAIAGTMAIVRRGTDHKRGWVIVGASKRLPDDMAPMIILDASARLRGTYKAWQESGGNVVWMAPALIQYDNIEFRWWNKGCGKTALADRVTRESILGPVADLINAHSEEEWLVIHAKAVPSSKGASGYDIPTELGLMLTNPKKVSYLHWGLHLGCNDYRHIRNVVVLGALNYSDGGYESVHMASTGLPAGHPTNDNWRPIEGGEFKHHHYQAICRSNVRNAVDGICGEATVYIVTPTAGDRKSLLKDAFPGCSIVDWNPIAKRPAKKTQLVMNELTTQFDVKGRSMITLKELSELCGRKNSSFLTPLFKNAEFKAFLSSMKIVRYKRRLMRSVQPTSMAA